ncbi:acetyl-CoA carboxylase [Emiliania huxleyi CCMP1516]|uniref:Acetyl-CoA carboxylase n=2 Tax=Emiliania huxleyi TaxID=2903 RepID=A0A0D3K8S9_EMIH1|nr:acetyl-CoA carboxylase [Emiliania huxleyi CCMP1516]EOD32164.1 acetyl-CoA carboxylase [Emiliania huxleyi CCMP1516]|eukprot:XP_005784593.1 acetyl-CoA carboxylase [Emiliania huxleyi CCMP1516]
MTAAAEYEAYVRDAGGERCIRSILVANNGMAASKFIMSIRNWLFERFGDASLIRIVSMATSEDIRANAMHLHHADSFVEVPAGANFNNYANVEVIVRLARENRVDAVWPGVLGWGHASENPALPQALEANGITFVGPTDKAMFLLGDKIASTIIAESAGVPCVSWSGTGVRVEPDASGHVTVPDDKFAEACVTSAEQAVEVAERVGYPIMIKASEGGGGKGVRMATKKEQIAPMYQAVCDEVKGSPVFLMRLCTGARHIEIQLMADKKGNVAVLSGRDCSMQRRFQKIVEEGPPRAVAPETLDQMERAAASLCRMVNYTHAGTVEYLFIQETQEFYFLELNPRLQAGTQPAADPAGDGITETNLPALQLMCAAGMDLSKLPASDDISRFLSTPDKPYVDPFSKVKGHVIATRITAENAADGWKPTVGKIEELSFQSLPSVWGYFSAQRKIMLAVKRIRCIGEIHTNITSVEERPAAGAGRETALVTVPASSVAICGALLKAHIAICATEAKIKKEYLWRNACPPPELLAQLTELKVEFIWNKTKFEFEVYRHSPELFTISANGSLASVKLKPTPGGNLVATYGNRTDTFHFMEEPGDKIRMVLNGVVAMLEKENDPSVLVAPYGGKLTRWFAEDGSHLTKGGAFAEMEVMKMLFALPAAEAGTITLLKPANVFVEAGEQIAKLELDDPSLVARAVPFNEPLGDLEPPPEMREDNIAVHQQVAYLIARAHHMLGGFVDNEDDVLNKLSELLLDQRAAATAFKNASEPVAAFGEKYKSGMLDMSTFTLTAILEHFLEVEQAKQIIANCRDNIAEQNKELVLPVLKKMAGNSMEPQAELDTVDGLAAELKLCQPKLLSMISTSDKALKRAIIRASVMLWYRQGGMSNVSFKTYLRKGKEKSAVTWEYTSAAGEPRFGILLTFQTMEDLENNFDDLCKLALEEKRTEEAPKLQRPMSRNASAQARQEAPAPSRGGAQPLLTAASCEQALKELAASPGTNASGRSSAKEVCLHVLVLGEFKPLDAATKANLPHKSFRRSYAYAVMDETKSSTSYQRFAGFLRSSMVESVTVMLPHSTATDNLNYTSIYNFPAFQSFDEHKITRHILPPEATLLELGRLSNFNVERCWFPDAPHTHVYYASAKQQKLDTRLFVRTLHSRAPAATEDEAVESIATLCGTEMAVTLATLEQAIGDSRYQITESNHIFFRATSPLCIGADGVIKTIRSILPQYQAAFSALRATELELVLPLWAPSTPKSALASTAPTIVRIICRLGPSMTIDVYEEVCRDDGSLGLRQMRQAAGGALTPSSGSPVALEPYALLSVVDQKRLRCQKLLTTYCYDFIHLFEIAVGAAWEKASAADPSLSAPAEKVVATELVLSPDGSCVVPLEAPCKPGSNKIGMIAWDVTLYTPEFPAGRTIIVIANDITFMQGTFGPLEDLVFERASQFARELGVPRIYMAANAGARFGLSEAVKKCFRVQWVGGDDPAKGIAYLWLTDKDREALGDAVVTERVDAPPSDEDEDEAEEPPVRFHNKITAIIGKEEEGGLGVESLQMAGAIAAETSIANREIFTLSYSTARNIGIGSYVLRLGQRVIQQRDAPIILTGYMALNKLLGTTVYESNGQLGGPEVMGGNGVSHLVVDNDLDAVHRIVQWMSFIPHKVGAPLPIIKPADPIERSVDYLPVKGVPYDPRELLTGGVQDGVYRSGLLDKDSFVETLSDWAKTVIVGRGRIGGMPLGVIVTENRLVEKDILADPANLESKPQVQMQAGQVWFPDSAYKTAQAIQDFNTGEGLPLLVMANWRGFSGGRKDMFEEVLKFGSFIVDQLTQFRQPISVYIPPFSEIRGGAWVVIDSKINPAFMEMYASETARGGVLEPPGIAEIKFRKPDVIKTMTRIDKQLQWMSMNEATGVVRAEDIETRKAELLAYYQPLGETIADLHDRPERMLAKGVIRSIVPWAKARSFFYWRIRRRVREEELVKALMAAASLSHDEALAQLHEKLPADVCADDRRCCEVLTSAEAD